VQHPALRLVVASTGTLNDQMLGQLIDPAEQAAGRFERGIWVSGDGRVLILPNLDRLPFLRAMAHAKAVLYPTRYEGFGLPSIEAMALRTPLIAGDATSVPEVVGDAGILVPPDDQPGFTRAMEQLLTDRSLRESLIQKGSERLKLFTPARMGERMLHVFSGMLA
jgi:glycosyltransferase involved in cell wall biosynthesis